MKKESKRLLWHEQKHLGVTCAFAKKGNDALAGGKTLAEVAQALTNTWGAAQVKYDSETSHGCKAGPQATWNTNIAKGLPAIKLF
jgi:hypothetical protein